MVQSVNCLLYICEALNWIPRTYLKKKKKKLSMLVIPLLERQGQMDPWSSKVRQPRSENLSLVKDAPSGGGELTVSGEQEQEAEMM